MLNKDVAATILIILEVHPQGDDESYKKAVSLMQQIASGDTIADLWSVGDVQQAADMEYGEPGEDGHREIEPDTARAALEMASNKMDANTGINWEWLQYCLDSVESE